MTQSDTANAPKSTALAIVVSIIASIIFYLLYELLFGFFVGLYAHYDTSFGEGIGALVLMVFGTNVLGIISGVAVTKKLFPRASAAGVFYALSTLLILSGLFSVLREYSDPAGSVVVVVINFVIIGITIAALRIYLRPAEARLLSDT